MLKHDIELEALVGQFRGRIVAPSDPDYASARRVRNSMYDRYPFAVAQCEGVADVQAAIRFCRMHELPIAVRCGNHSVHGYGSCDAGLVIDLGTRMRGVYVDPAARTARAQGGANWGDFDRETQVFGLATTGGRVTDTGIGGLTLGSGSGWLERMAGLTCDNLIGAELVTADGAIVKVDAENDPDLLWGLRGGGGNFGVVTSFEYRLHAVGPIVLGGNLVFPADRAFEVVCAWRDYVDNAPDNLGPGIHFYVMPDYPGVPPEIANRPVVSLFVCFAGDVAEGERVIAPLRALEPALDLVQPMSYTALQGLSDEVLPPDQRNYWKAENLSGLTDACVQTLVDGSEELAVTSPLGIVALYPKGRAITAVRDDETALAGRSSPYSVYAWSLWQDAEHDRVNIDQTRKLFQALEQHIDPGVSTNFSSDEDSSHLRASFGSRDRFDRLRDLKRRCDPDNVFRLNQNIDPNGGSRGDA